MTRPIYARASRPLRLAKRSREPRAGDREERAAGRRDRHHQTLVALSHGPRQVIQGFSGACDSYQRHRKAGWIPRTTTIRHQCGSRSDIRTTIVDTRYGDIRDSCAGPSASRRPGDCDPDRPRWDCAPKLLRLLIGVTGSQESHLSSRPESFAPSTEVRTPSDGLFSSDSRRVSPIGC